MYCWVTKKFPMLCHTLSIQVCRSTCFMKCKHTFKRYRYYNLLRLHWKKKPKKKNQTNKKKDWNLLKDSHADGTEAPCVSGGSVETFWVCCSHSAAAFSLCVRSQQRCLHKCPCVSRFGMSCWLKAFTHRMRVFCVQGVRKRIQSADRAWVSSRRMQMSLPIPNPKRCLTDVTQIKLNERLFLF